MEWTPTYPKKPAYHWAFMQSEAVTILRRTGRNGIWAFGGEAVESTEIKLWGSVVDIIEFDWSKIAPTEEGWYGVAYDNKTKGIVRLAKGDSIHCYDFELKAEIDYKLIVSWSGIISVPPAPPTSK